MERLPHRSIRWDEVVHRLQEQRRRAGEPSYAELARTVTDLRTARGLDEHAARVARTTVYDAFRTGRSRVNLALVRDLAEALGATRTEVDRWVETARFLEPAGAVPDTAVTELAGPGRRLAVLFVVGCVLVNVAGRVLVDTLHLPIYLDMVGTAVVALGLGPWIGAGVGLASNALGVLSSGPASLPFGLVNAAGALVWGYGVRRGLGRTIPRFFALGLVVALTCTLVAVPILVVGFSGSTGHGEDTIVANLQAVGENLVVSVTGANLLVSVADKTISGFLALVALSLFPWARRRGLELLAPPPGASA